MELSDERKQQIDQMLETAIAVYNTWSIQWSVKAIGGHRYFPPSGFGSLEESKAAVEYMHKTYTGVTAYVNTWHRCVKHVTKKRTPKRPPDAPVSRRLAEYID